MPEQESSRAGLFPAFLFFFLLFFGLFFSILSKNEGTFTYTQDASYIRLALAGRISHGDYGVNAGEFAAPVSSILWPFLLSPLASAPIGLFFPLTLNFLASIGTLFIFHEFIQRSLRDVDQKKRAFFHPLLLIFLIPVTQLTGLAFTGMEHSLQLFLTAIFFFGLVRYEETHSPPWWFCLAIFLGPLVRYENLALSIPAVFFLGIRKHHMIFFVTSLCFLVPIAIFSFFLYSHDFSVLPTSITDNLLSLPFLSNEGAQGTLFTNLLENLSNRQGAILALFSSIFFIFSLRTRENETCSQERWVAAFAAFGGFSILLAGKIGCFSRYEIFLWGNFPVLLLWVLREKITEFLNKEPPYKAICAGFAVFFSASLPYIMTTFAVPTAAHNIFGLPYQLHRFIREYYRAPVAINDLGLAVYANDAYVLRLPGLPSKEALKAWPPEAIGGAKTMGTTEKTRTQRGSGECMNSMAHEKGVSLAMVFPNIFSEIPANWKLLGKLVFSDPRIVSANEAILFYALDDQVIPRVNALLDVFASSLPSCTRFEKN